MKDAPISSAKPNQKSIAAERGKDSALTASVHLHIDELRLDGFRPGDKFAIAEALQHELARLLTEHVGAEGTLDFLDQNASVEMLDAGAIRASAGAGPGAVGRDIARNIHRSLITGPGGSGPVR